MGESELVDGERDDEKVCACNLAGWRVAETALAATVGDAHPASAVRGATSSAIKDDCGVGLLGKGRCVGCYYSCAAQDNAVICMHFI